MARRSDLHDDQAWALALRAAATTSLLGAAAAGALHRFAGVDAGLLVGAGTVVATMVGLRLPAARPTWLHRPA